MERAGAASFSFMVMRCPNWPTVSVSATPSLKRFGSGMKRPSRCAASYPCQAVLLDAYVPGAEGGTGATWDHSLVGRTAFDKPVIVAGGLTAENVADAISAASPYGVDTASGVESSLRVKSLERMQAFMNACGR